MRGTSTTTWQTRHGVNPTLAALSIGSHAPFLIASGWWAFCFILYVSDWPIHYTHRNVGFVAALISATWICSAAGFQIGVRGVNKRDQVGSGRRLPLPVILGFAAALILVIPMTLTYSGLGPLDIATALTDPAAAYARESQRIAEGFESRSAIVVIQALVAPLTMSVVPILALAWFESRRHGVMFVLSLLPAFYLGILGGRSVGVGLAGILLFGAWLVSRARRAIPIGRRDVAVLVIVAAAGLAAFGAQKVARYGGAPICPAGSSQCTSPNPNLLEGSWVLFASYASQGFEGLGHALDARWVFGWGFSHSVAVASIVERFLHIQPMVVTSQLSSLGWSSTGLWSTALASIANDVPWPLVPLVIGAQCALLGFAWRRSVEDADWVAVTVFCYTFIAILFVPQNLQLAVSGPLYFGYIILVMLFLARAIRKAWLARRVTAPAAGAG